MSKTVYLIQLIKAPGSSAKFKFAIENTKKSIKDLKEQIKQRLILKNQLINQDEITIKDQDDFELCSDDDIQDVLPDQQKTIRVTLKKSLVISAISNQPAVVVSSQNLQPVNQPVIPVSLIASQSVSLPAVDDKPFLVDAFLKPGRVVKPYQFAPHDQKYIQLKLICPQFQNPSIMYGVLVQKQINYWNLSKQILVLFGLDNTNLKALLFNSAGVPLFWSIDYMGLTAQDLSADQIYTVIFTTTSSSLQTPVPSPDIAIQNTKIYLKFNNGNAQEIMIDLETCTVDNLRRKIFEKLRVHPKNQLVKFGLQVSDNDSQLLKSLGIGETSLVDVYYKSRHHPVALTFNDNMYSQGIQHIFKQTVQGLRRFRSNVLIVGYHTPQNIQSKFLALIRQLSNQNSALITALKTLFLKKKLCETQKICLQQSLFCIFRDFMIKSKDFPKHYLAQDLFLATRECFGYLLSAAKNLKDSNQFKDVENYQVYSSNCPLTSQKIYEPVYLTLDDKSKIVTDKNLVLLKIKNNLTFIGINKLIESLISESQALSQIYLNFKQNLNLNPNISFQIVKWTVHQNPIDIVQTYVNNVVLANPYTFYAPNMQSISPDLKIFNVLQLRTKCQYQYLLQDKQGEEKIYVGKSKDVNLPHNIFDVITGGEVGVNFNIMGGATGSENVDVVVQGKIEAVITKQPAEAIVVLLDISGSMGGRFFNEPDLIRIGAVKSFFEAFAYRTMAYNFEHVISLVLFDNVSEMKVDFTESFQDFNLLVANAKPRGGTLLFDAISSASDNLIKLRNKYPNVILRILALTDGEDTGSHTSIQKAATKVISNNIVIDSFVVGSNCQGLKALTFAAGGRCYLTRNMEQSLKLFEQETVLSCRARKQQDRADASNVYQLVERMKLRPFTYTSNVYQFKIPQMTKPTVSTSKLITELADPKKLQKVAPTGSLKRVVKELQNYQNDPHPFVTVFPCPEMNLWKILLYGPKQTPYEGGLFLMYAKFPNDYPFKAPEVRFITPIYHCNMNSQGRICHSIFDRNYSPAITFKQIVDAVYGLILTPEPDDPLDSVIASFFLSEYPKYHYNATESTKTHASKSVQEIVEELFGNISDDNDRQMKIKELRDWVQKAQTFN